MPNIILFLSKLTRKLHIEKIVFKGLNRLYINKNVRENNYQADKLLNSIRIDPNNSCICQNTIQIEIDLQIIIPVYKAEKYIEECMDSVIFQKTKYNFIVTVINDGSPDNSRKILSKYEQYPNVEIIDQENRGFSGARNRGLDVIKGRYIMFVDSDDKLNDNAIESLMDTAQHLDADIVEGGHYIYRNNQIIRTISKKNNDNERKLLGFPWGKIIKSDLFKNIHYPVDYWFEDTIFILIIYPLCKRMVSISSIVYYYRTNYEGISHTSQGNTKVLDSFYITRRLLKDRLSLGIQTTQEMYEDFFAQTRTNARRIYSLNNKEVNKAIFVETQKLKKTHFPEFHTKEVENSYLENALLTGNYYKYIISCIFQ